MNAAPRSDTRIMAVFCDFENVALGVRDVKIASFDIRKVLERLLLKGNIVVKKATATGSATRTTSARCTRRPSS
jgi:hypothetical protein